MKKIHSYFAISVVFYLLICLNHFVVANNNSDTSVSDYNRAHLSSLSSKSLKIYSIKEDSVFSISPIVNLNAGSGTSFLYSGLLGFSIDRQFSDKLDLNFSIYGGVWRTPDYLTLKKYTNEALPSYGFISDLGNSSVNALIDPQLAVDYKPSKYFKFTLGWGKHFIGNGYRSLLLSDHAFSYPYIKIETKIWKLRYYNVWALQGHRFPSSNTVTSKFSASHYLSYDAKNWLSIALFETIIWEGGDQSYNRGLDVNYLNPVIFYRPIEYSLGSSDNALMGMNLRLGKQNRHFYSQILLDEFLLNEVRRDFKRSIGISSADTVWGWWANKYAIQLGFKDENLFGVRNLMGRIEYNFARPYTYSHGSAAQNYGHNKLPLAHPLGANFSEGIIQLSYLLKNRWVLDLNYSLANVGFDKDSLNYGKDIFQSYNNRVSTYKNFTTQGKNTHLSNFKLEFSYLILENTNSRLFLGTQLRKQTDSQLIDQQYYIYAGFKINFSDPYTDY